MRKKSINQQITNSQDTNRRINIKSKDLQTIPKN